MDLHWRRERRFVTAAMRLDSLTLHGLRVCLRRRRRIFICSPSDSRTPPTPTTLAATPSPSTSRLLRSLAAASVETEVGALPVWGAPSTPKSSGVSRPFPRHRLGFTGPILERHRHPSRSPIDDRRAEPSL